MAASAQALAHAAELERRDTEIATELDAVRSLEERVGAIRERVGVVREALERVPLEQESLGRLRDEADAAVAAARAEAERTAARVASLESGRRKRDDELDRARKEAATARDALADALATRTRIDERGSALAEEERVLRAEAGELAEAAVRVAEDVRDVGRVTESAGRAPGTSHAALEEWGSRVRSALFVARGILETERERVVVEANVLGASVLGEQLGASSVALVRRRLESAAG
jgi:chromosome segregation ATPase